MRKVFHYVPFNIVGFYLQESNLPSLPHPFLLLLFLLFFSSSSCFSIIHTYNVHMHVLYVMIYNAYAHKCVCVRVQTKDSVWVSFQTSCGRIGSVRFFVLCLLCPNTYLLQGAVFTSPSSPALAQLDAHGGPETPGSRLNPLPRSSLYAQVCPESGRPSVIATRRTPSVPSPRQKAVVLFSVSPVLYRSFRRQVDIGRSGGPHPPGAAGVDVLGYPEEDNFPRLAQENE